MNNITLGKYVPYDSFVHRLDPRFKIFAMILLMVSVFLRFASIPMNFIVYGVLLIFVFALMLSAHVRISAPVPPVEDDVVHDFLHSPHQYVGSGRRFARLFHAVRLLENLFQRVIQYALHRPSAHHHDRDFHGLDGDHHAFAVDRRSGMVYVSVEIRPLSGA